MLLSKKVVSVGPCIRVNSIRRSEKYREVAMSRHEGKFVFSFRFRNCGFLFEKNCPLKFHYGTETTVFPAAFTTATVSKSGRFIELRP